LFQGVATPHECSYENGPRLGCPLLPLTSQLLISLEIER
jgi:hypothetical protein